MDTAITLKFADGEYRFWLPWPQVIELERKCGTRLPDGSTRGKSIFQIYEELGEGLGRGLDDNPVFIGGGKANAIDVKEVIRLGLIGGNEGLVDGGAITVSPLVAGQLTDDYCYPARPLSEGLGVAWAILHAAIVGIEVKKKPESAEVKAVTTPAKRTQSPSVKAA